MDERDDLTEVYKAHAIVHANHKHEFLNYIRDEFKDKNLYKLIKKAYKKYKNKYAIRKPVKKEAFISALLLLMYDPLHRSQRIQTYIMVMSKLISKNTSTISLNTAAELVNELKNIGLINVYTDRESSKYYVLVSHKQPCSKKTQKYVDLISKVTLPCIIKPLPYMDYDLIHGGEPISGTPIIKGIKPKILKDMLVPYDVINIQNAIEFSINMEIFNKVANVRKPKDTDTRFKVKRIKQDWVSLLTIYDESVEWINTNARKFYFTHFLDKRGRVYPISYPVSYMGSNYDKSIIELYCKRTVSKEGMKWLEIHVANTLDVDKVTFIERREYVRNHVRAGTLWGEIDELDEWDKPMAIAAVTAYYKCQDTTYKTGMLVGFDASCSGLSIYSMLTYDLKGMLHTNVISGDKFYDAYTEVGDIVNKFSPIQITRKLLKEAVMTTLYNATVKPMEILGKAYPTFIGVLCSLYSKTIDALNRINNVVKPTRKVYKYSLPDIDVSLSPKSIVQQVIVKYGSFDLLFKFKDKDTVDLGNYRFLAPSIIQSIDALLCRSTIRLCAEKGVTVVTIHDCYHVSPDDVPTVIWAYKKSCKAIIKADLLSNILSQLEGKDVSVMRMTKKQRKLLFKKIDKSVHVLN